MVAANPGRYGLGCPAPVVWSPDELVAKYGVRAQEIRPIGLTRRGQALRQAHLPQSGMQTTVHGAFDLYARSGEVQIVVDSVQPAGLGLAAAAGRDRQHPQTPQ